MGSSIILWQIAFGQNGGTPTTTTVAPPQVSTSPNPNLQFIPQKAYIVTTPDGQIQAVPIQETSSSANLGLGETAGILGLLTAVGTGVWNKITASKDNKQTNAAVLQGMTVDSELAKYIDKIADPAKVAAVEGTAPAVKIATLEKNKEEFADKAVKK